MLKCAGRFFYTMSNRIPFQKPYTSAHDLVCLLQSRGLTVTDTAKAESYLEYIGYYRLSAYMYPLLQMPKEQHRYKPNTTFSQVMMLFLPTTRPLTSTQWASLVGGRANRYGNRHNYTRRARIGCFPSSPDLIEKNAPTIEKLSLN